MYELVLNYSVHRRPDPAPEAEPRAQGQAEPQPQPPPRPALAQPAQPQTSRPAQATRAAQPRPPSPPADLDDMYVDDDVDPDVLLEMEMQMDREMEKEKEWEKEREKERGEMRPPPVPAYPARLAPVKPPSTSNEKYIPSTNATLKPSSSSSLNPASTSFTLKTSPYFPKPSTSKTKAIPDIGLSPVHAPLPKLESDFDITWDSDDAEAFKSSRKTLGSTSAKPSVSSPSKPTARSDKPPSSPDPYDDLSFDMDVDESFFEQVGRIEQGALSAGSKDTAKGKGKENDTRTGGTSSDIRLRSNWGMGTKSLDLCPVSPSGAKISARIRNKGPTGTLSLIGLQEPRPPPSTQPLPKSSAKDTLLPPPSTQPRRRRLPREASIIVISSSEDEESEGGAKRKDHGASKPLTLARRRAHNNSKAREGAVEVNEGIIDISDASE
jgi:hypothetical protein